jgi:hypothetical protein
METEPRVLGNAFDVAAAPDDGRAGALWKLEPDPRHLDSNIVRVPADTAIAPHAGPDLDVMMLVLGGGGELLTASDRIPLSPGALVWLPRLSSRSIAAGPDGLTYLTVHPKRPPMTIQKRSG